MDANQVGDRGGNFTFAKAGLAAGTTTGTFKTVNSVGFTVDGIFATYAGTDNLAFTAAAVPPTGGPGGTLGPAPTNVLGNSQEAVFAVWISAAGVVSTTMGKIWNTADLSATLGKSAVSLPDMQSNLALIGLIKVLTSAVATFTPGTTGLAASGITAAYYDCSRMPTKAFLT